MNIFFFFNDPATTEIYTLSLHDALPICMARLSGSRPRSARTAGASATSCTTVAASLAGPVQAQPLGRPGFGLASGWAWTGRLAEQTSELQSLAYLVCRLLLVKKKFQANV